MKRFGFYAILAMLAGLLLSCNRSIGDADVITTPAVNTLIAAGTKPAPLAAPQKTVLPGLEVTPLPQTTTDASEPALPAPTGVFSDVQALYAVIQLGEADLLNVRVEPGLSGHVLLTLPPQQRGLKSTGRVEVVDEVRWAEINLPDGGTGWVSQQFLTEQVEGDVFCQSSEVSALLDRFVASVKDRDSEALPALVSPAHGLTIYHNVWNPPVSFDRPEVLQKLYISTVDYDWGLQEGSGSPLVGPFKDLVFPKLQDVMSFPHTRQCNVLEKGVSAGNTSGQVYWPPEYANLNYVALYRAAPASQEMNWRTWVVGVEYVAGVPYIAVLMQFYWEI